MKTMIKLVIGILLAITFLSVYRAYRDRQILQEDLIRLHVVANSNSEEDQEIKLMVRDAITEYLKPIMEKVPNKEQALQFMRENLGAIEEIANDVLARIGANESAVVSLEPEAFGTREYDTFTLPAGVYDALRIEIGEGDGKNWWCVVFPTLCIPATSGGFQDMAVSTGFSETLTDTLANKDGYQLRFFLLDCIGRIENILFYFN